jgi:hypothetical protein
MDTNILMNIATMAISLSALVISILLNLRQLRLASGGNHLPVVIDAFKETRSAAWKLVAYDMIDERLVIGSYGTNIVRLWDALAPYVYTERHKHGLHFWIFFEDLAARTAATHPEVVYADLRMRSRPPLPRQEPEAVETAS